MPVNCPSTPAPSISQPHKIPQPHKPLITHVNMQLDSFLANSNVDDLRAIVRALLATGPVGTTPAFTKIARNRVQNTALRRLPSPSSCFATDATTGLSSPTPALWTTVAKARSLFCVGLGFQAIPILVTIVQAAKSVKFDLDSDMEDALIVLDADIAQCLQSCREQLEAGDVTQAVDMDSARNALASLRVALQECQTAIEAWGGEFPLEKGILALEGWKL